MSAESQAEAPAAPSPLLDMEAIRQAVFAEHNISLRSDDPILLTALFNSKILSSIGERLNDALVRSLNDIAALNAQQLEIAKLTAEQLVTEAAAFLQAENAKSVSAARQALDAHFAGHLKALDGRLAAITVANGAPRSSSSLAVIIAGLAAIVALAALAVAVLR